MATIDQGNMEEWRNNFISGFLGLLGISMVLFGIQQALNPATDAFGRVLIIGGLLLSYGAWRFWPVSTTEELTILPIMNPPPPLQRGFRQRLLEFQSS